MRDSEQDQPRYTSDFGFIPIPKRLQYDPDVPFNFGLLHQIYFGIASCFGGSLRFCPENRFKKLPSRGQLVLLPALAEYVQYYLPV
jgi:hypothetical protein